MVCTQKCVGDYLNIYIIEYTIKYSSECLYGQKDSCVCKFHVIIINLNNINL